MVSVMTDDSLDEDPLPQDQDPSKEANEAPCPFCREMVSEHAEVCPHCGSYLSREDAPRTSASLRTRVVAVILIVMLSGVAVLIFR